MARKRKSKPTSKVRGGKQAIVQRLSHAIEDAQLAGIIQTRPMPEVALRGQQAVNPATQDEQRFPGLDRMAIREGDGWGVPEHVKRRVVEKSAEVLFEKRFIYDAAGNQIELPPNRKAEQEAAKTLLTADQQQFKRDEPERAGKAEGGPGGLIGELAQIMQAAQAQRDGKLLELPAKLGDSPTKVETNGTGAKQ